MPLVMAPGDREMEVKKISADEKTKKHLREIGIAEGCKIMLVSGSNNGVIVIVKEGRLCLDGALARKILVA
ncbi:MAG: ferrous iron transport protein A [Clostridia bacterium]|nr:ferrous iron transport protein A [Clostridia bacterium]